MGSNTHSVAKHTKENTTYRKKPVEIHAVKWNGERDLQPIREWVELFGDDFAKWFGGNTVSAGNENELQPNAPLLINTLESNGNLHTASVGDYICRGIKGEYYACKPDIFLQSNEKVPAPLASAN